MNLNAGGFFGIKDGRQLIEVRLNDEKRSRIEIGDSIVFTLLPDAKESIRTKVVGLLKYDSFEELFSNMDLAEWNAKDWTIGQAIDCCHGYYSIEDEKKHGVLGIRLELL